MLARLVDELGSALAPLRFGAPVAYTYNPLVYARRMLDSYIERYGAGTRELILVGMNPGPWGMGQTGIPFGAVPAVRDWLGLDEPIEQAAEPHPKRPVEGLRCTRNEVSGQRVWGWAQSRFGSPERFFARAFVWSYCPLLFLDAGARNVPLDKLERSELRAVYAPCDAAIQALVAAMRPRVVVGVGRFTALRLEQALVGPNVVVGHVMHPSPANAAANSGWAEHVDERLRALGVELG